jgi:fluoride exporter
MIKVLLVALGGAVGSVLRYLASGIAQDLFRSATFPVGTLLVNLAGCLLIGAGSQLAESRGAFADTTRVLLFVGVLGGFTTFSAFSNETFNLFRAGSTTLGWLNAGAQLAGGLACVWLGRSLAFAVWR